MPTITCTVAGGQLPYHFALSGNPLPAGIVMNQTNGTTVVFSGTPTATGPLPFVLTVTDSSLPTAQVANSSFGSSLSPVAPQLAMTCTPSTGPVAVGQTYTSTCASTGGFGGANVSFSGTLPAGLTRNNFTIAGTPTSPGPYSYTVMFTDFLSAAFSGPITVSKTFSGTIAPGTVLTPLTANCNYPMATPLNEFTVGVPATPVSCTVSGGTPPYMWSVPSGTLPAGITITGTTANTISFGGTPLVSGQFIVRPMVTDSTIPVPLTATGFIIYSVSDRLTLTCTSNLGPTAVGTRYAVTCQANGGHNPYSLSIAPGALPSGLASSLTGTVITDSIVISGTPTVPGPYNYTVTLTDASPPTPLTASQSFAGVIAGTATCTYALNPSGQAFPAQGGTGTVNITAAPGCPWTVANLPAGVTLTSPPAGTGNGSVTFQVAANSGGAIVNAFTIAGQPFTVQQQAASVTGLSIVGSMPHLAAEENWTTTFTLVNKSTSSATARLSLFGDPSGILTLPLTFPQQTTAQNPLLAASLDEPVTANASLIVQTAGPQTPPVLVGSAQLAATGAVDGFAIFHLIPGAQEAVVPLETRNANSYLLAFDNTGGVVLGVAVENVSAQAGSIGIVIRDDTGAQIGSGTISMLANGHTSFVLSTQYPVTANKRGTVEFDTPPGGQISVLGIRTTPLGTTNTLTTIPALANVGTNGGSIAHLATGNGWQTTLVLVNSGTNAAQVHLNFFADVTGAPLSLPISFPQLGSAVSTVSSVTQTLAAGATLLVQSAAPLSNPAPTTGSAQLTTSGNVSGFVIFRYNPNGQEAVVPLESRTANGYLIAFDNTAGTATGIALNSISSQTVNVPVVVRDDAGNQIATDTLNLAANGHLAFTLATDKYPMTANIRGTIEFDTPAGGQIGALGIRIPVGHTFTTLPALAK